jgi:hypothetical protein
MEQVEIFKDQEDEQSLISGERTSEEGATKRARERLETDYNWLRAAESYDEAHALKFCHSF